jgi:hypothetical protein
VTQKCDPSVPTAAEDGSIDLNGPSVKRTEFSVLQRIQGAQKLKTTDCNDGSCLVLSRNTEHVSEFPTPAAYSCETWKAVVFGRPDRWQNGSIPLQYNPDMADRTACSCVTCPKCGTGVVVKQPALASRVERAIASHLSRARVLKGICL